MLFFILYSRYGDCKEYYFGGRNFRYSVRSLPTFQRKLLHRIQTEDVYVDKIIPDCMASNPIHKYLLI
jgi:hypothetical protein